MKISRILVPTDFSAGGGKALDYARLLAKELDAMIELVHVCEIPSTLGPELVVGLPGEPPVSVEDLIRSRGEVQLNDLLATVQDKGITARGRVLVGKPAELIVETATRDKVDLIVMGTHARRGLSRVVLGSIAESVIRSAPCPVLTVRNEDDGSM